MNMPWTVPAAAASVRTMPSPLSGATPTDQETPLANLGAALEAIRKKRRLTQAQVAERMGLASATQISEYESGAGMNTDTLGRYLIALEADTGDLAMALGQEPDEGTLLRFFSDLRGEMLRAAVEALAPAVAGTPAPQVPEVVPGKRRR